MTAPVLLASGVSARALAQAAAAAGWRPVVVDGFGDRDCPGEVHPIVPFTPRRVVQAARRWAIDAVALAAGWEHDPAALARLAEGRRRLAAPPAAIRAVRDPVHVARLLRMAGLPSLVTATGRRASPPLHSVAAPAVGVIRSWRAAARPTVAVAAAWPALVKPVRSGGGRGIEPFDDAHGRARRGRYLQEWRRGTTVSLVLAADGRTAIPLALTKQFVGLAWLGCSGTQYAGSIIAAGGGPIEGVPGSDVRLRDQLTRTAELLAQSTGLRGLIGVDGIVDDDGVFWLVEVNPRWCASFELLDTLLPTPLFALHVAACEGRLPDPWPLDRLPVRIAAKGVLYRDDAISCAHAPDLAAPRDAPWRVADIPREGAPLPPGAPVCTLLADGADEGTALARVRHGVDAIRQRLADAVQP